MLISGLIGTGKIAESLHIRAHQQLQGSRLKWVCDTDEEAARAFAAKHSIPRWTVDYDEMIRDPEVHWVDIATPNRSHEPLTLRALQAGKHVLCQKPLAHSVEAAERMVLAASEAQRLLGVYMSFRSDPVLGRLSRMIREGAFGHLISLRGKMISAGGFRLSQDQWRAQEASGALDLLGIHLIDLFIWLHGPIEWVQSYSTTLHASMNGDDVTTALYGFPDGVTAVMETTYCSFVGPETPMYVIEINGTEGSAQYRIETGELTIQLKQEYKDGETSYPHGAPFRLQTDSYGSDAYVAAVHQSFVDAMIGEAAVPVLGSMGLQALRIVEATRQAAKEQRRVIVTI